MFKPAKKIPHRHEVHGDVRHDDYFWMRERDSEGVLDFLKQENQRTSEALAPVAELEKKLYEEMRGRIREDDTSVPVYDAGYFYYSRYQTGQEYQLHCRKKASLSVAGTMEGAEVGPEEIILDENTAAVGHTYFDVGSSSTSPNQQFLAYTVDTFGRRIYTLYFKDLHSGKIAAEIAGVTPNFVWSADNKTVFYTRQDPETLRSYQVYRYEMGGAAELVYEEKDTTFNVWLTGGKQHRHLFMASTKRDSSEWRVLNAEQARGPWRVFLAREDNHEYSLIDGGDCFFILSNWQAQNFRLLQAPLSATDKNQWREVIKHDPKIFIEGVDEYSGHLVVTERENGLAQLRVFNRADQTSRVLKFPDPAYEVAGVGLPDYNSPFLRFKYESLVQPPSIYDEDWAASVGGNGTITRILRKVREVPGYHIDRYESLRLWAKAADGTAIPMSLVMKKGTKLNGKNPLLLYGYGSYGMTTDIYFRGSVMSLLDRGFIFVLGHVRGGSEMGRDWYETGRLRHKMNSFTDFIACAEKLIADQYTSPEHLHIMGGSAGGLLMGATVNLRPDLFKGVIAAVPFVDVLTTMLDESIPLTTGEYKEWGDPRIQEQYEWMRQYSPYDNVKAQAYPNILVTTGYHDSQVQYWEPAKWVARLREIKTDKNMLLFYTELSAGHSGASGRFEALKTLAKEYAFIIMLEGMKS